MLAYPLSNFLNNIRLNLSEFGKLGSIELLGLASRTLVAANSGLILTAQILVINLNYLFTYFTLHSSYPPTQNTGSFNHIFTPQKTASIDSNINISIHSLKGNCGEKKQTLISC